MNQLDEASYSLMEFIQKNPSCYHVISSMKDMLTEHGFSEIREHQIWNLKSGGRYFTTRSDSSLIAFCIPEERFQGFQIVAAHDDSPSFKIKENPEMFREKHYVSLNVEKYGGLLMSPWFDRPLSVAGRVLTAEGDSLRTHLVSIDRDLVCIPSLAIHMDRQVNEGHSYQIQKELIPIFGDETATGQFMKIIAENAGVDPSSILSHDLFLYSRSGSSVWGADKEYFSSARIDDMQCAYSAIQAFLDNHNPANITVCCIFDNEEVGSRSKQGADSTFLSDTLERISDCMGLDPQERKMALARSFMVSADNGHAVHPNYPEKADPTNRVYMNHGILIKYNAVQKYTTSAVSAAVFKRICNKAGVPFQTFANHSDIPGGSTLGHISTTHVSLDSVDIGLAQLAMHSPYETAGMKDTAYMIQALKTYFNTPILKDSEGNYQFD